MAGMIYDVMKKTTKQKHRKLLQENFKELMSCLEGLSQSGESVVPKYGQLNFIKHDYTMPEFNLVGETTELSADSSEVNLKKIKAQLKRYEI